MAKGANELLSKLSEIDPVFSETIHFNERKDFRIKIEQLILNSEWNEITEYEGNKKPTAEYKRIRILF